MGDRLTGEVITSQGNTSHIEYKYDKQGRLLEASADAGQVPRRPFPQGLFHGRRQGENSMRVIPARTCLAGLSTLLTLSAGAIFGQSTEVPKRTQFESGSQTASKLVRPTVSAPEAAKATPVADNSRGASSRAMDALSSSNEDLNVIRDCNIRGLTGGCAPEASARITDLAARLQAAGASAAEFSIEALRVPGGNSPARPGSESVALALASDWYKRSGDANSGISSKDQKEALLESVLPGAKRSTDSDQNVTGLRTELEQLLASCSAPKPVIR